MRLGVLDVGSNTVHLLVVDAHRGGHPIPTFSEKSELRLAELLRPDGALSRRGEDRLIEAICAARESAERYGTEDLVAFATSAVRDATNSESVLARVRAETGVALAVLTGPDEARMTFLAVRRWLGWSAGRLLVLDIGGGSLEIAGGIDEEPDVALSLPLGAGRLTRERLSGDPPRGKEVAALRQHVRTALAPLGPVLVEFGAPDRAVATSKTFRSLARLGGAAPYSKGPRVRRTLSAEPGQRPERLRCGHRPVRSTELHQHRPQRRERRANVLAQRSHLLPPRRIAGQPLAGEPAGAQRQGERDVRLLVDPAGDLQRTAADVEHE